MEPLKTIDAETLISTPLRPVHFIVDRLIPPGIHILGGSSKIGKSWMMTWLCLKVALGEDVWEFKTEKCSVLNLALEDTPKRVQERLFHLSDNTPADLHFSFSAKSITGGLPEQLEAFLTQHPDTRLIVIDTLQRVRAVTSDSNAYANDYRDISVLKQVSDKYGIAIVIIHHLRKLGSPDPFQRLSGTTGLTGAVDSNFVLDRENPASNTARLYINGRDIGYQEYTLRFENCIWQMVSCDTEELINVPQAPPFLFRLADYMAARSDWQGSATELLVALKDSDTPINAVTKYLNQFHSTFLASGISHILLSAPAKQGKLPCFAVTVVTGVTVIFR